MTEEAARAPWERMPGESARAYAAFCIYRDLGPQRSIAAVAERLPGVRAPRRAKRPLERWSSRWNWVERARAWDEEQERLARQEKARAVREMCERHARIAVAMLQKAVERLRSLNPEDLEPLDVVKFIVEAAKLERLARGEPEQTLQAEQQIIVRWVPDDG